ncbi:MAG: hydantoinase/oxoprolinase family protein, partial [Pirellulales bacterium]
PTIREFERSMTTVLNAYVMPLISDYVGRLESRLAEEGISQARLLFVKSNGGVAGADTIRHEPVQTALSGPAAGIIGAQNVGRMVGEQRLITLDIGGTSADICLIDGDRPTITTEGSVGHWPVHLPMMAIHTIGAGGGSIARAADGGLTVGPASAGADPGPACYGRGGTEATVTDAHLVLGYLPKRLLDGAMALDLDAATRAIERLANKLGTSTAEAARGVIDVVNNNMIGAIRVVSVERGYNPKEFALVPFGGAGPLHGGFIMRLLGMKASIVARGCGVLSSRGLLIADMKSDFTRTLLLRPPYADLTPLHRLFSELEERAAAWLSVEGVPASGQEIHRFVSFRYANQGYELDVPWLAEGVTMPALQQAIEAFHATHRRLYTFEQRDAQVELTGIRIEAVGRLAKPKAWEAEEGAKSDARTGSQKLYFGGEWVTCGVYDRTRLGDVELVGPAIIEQMDATTLVLPKQVCRSDEHGNLIVREG